MNPTSIPYADLSWNIVTGCSPAGEGCLNCWAARLAATRLKHLPRYKGLAQKCPGGYEWTGEVRFHEDLLDQPRRLRDTPPRRIFVAPMGDLFHHEIQHEQGRDALVALSALEGTDHKALLLTKRSARMATYYAWEPTSKLMRLDHLWVGVSAWDQDSLQPPLIDFSSVRPAHAWLSLEPLLGPVDLREIIGLLSWAVVGGESGPNARPCNPEWIVRIWKQCKAANVPFYFKQWGDNVPAGSFSRDDNALVEIANTREIPCSK